jgi:predicted DNA-binding transcriptional regulator AlpA
MTQPLDRKFRTREVAELEGCSTRWIAEKVRAGLFPPPDVPAERHGAPDYWYESTLRRFREERAAARQSTVERVRAQRAQLVAARQKVA